MTPRRAAKVVGADLAGMARGIREFLRAAIGRALEGELTRTPGRVARAWNDDLLAGYREDPAAILTPLRSERSRDLVALRGIEFVSTCSHHLLPFHGTVHLAYLPDGRITGISRLPKLVRCLSRRLQIQEDLTRRLADELARGLRPRGAACVIEASHLCMSARGGRGSSGTVVTTAFTGVYESDARERSQIVSLLLGRARDGRGVRAGGRSRREGTARRARRRSRR
ncbi:MAG: GTP cyclohydrolase I [Acidobacteria bacterium]|nr:GTP cyclohydrolase I [Acidobacteriota bacterium]